MTPKITKRNEFSSLEALFVAKDSCKDVSNDTKDRKKK